MQLFNKVLTALLVIFLAVFLLLFILLPERAFSGTEKRALAGRPDLSFKKLLSGKFAAGWEGYLADQFPFREYWVKLRGGAEVLLGKKEINGVYLGREGYLLQKEDRSVEALLQANLQAVNDFAGSLAAGIYFLPAPSALHVHRDKLPSFAEPGRLTLPAAVGAKLHPDICVIDVQKVLTAHKDEYIYYRTDHHWTVAGAYYAYRETGAAMGFQPLARDDLRFKKACSDFSGTLAAKSTSPFVRPDEIFYYAPPEELQLRVEYVDAGKSADSLYEPRHLQTHDKYAFFLDGNHGLLRIYARNGSGRRLLLVKDSYANCLIPFLTHHFAEIHVVDLRFFSGKLSDYAIENGLNEILFIYNTLNFAGEPSVRKLM